jgi:hypothetical protein
MLRASGTKAGEEEEEEEAPYLVRSVTRNSDAWNKGVRPGMQLLSIDGHALTAQSPQAVDSQLSGPAYTSVACELEEPASSLTSVAYPVCRLLEIELDCAIPRPNLVVSLHAFACALHVVLCVFLCVCESDCVSV